MSEFIRTSQKDKDALFNKITSCSKCSKRYGKEPFHFPLKNQKVMLISACPSIQAMHRPLTSVRFFRNICVALFGEKGVSIEAIDAMHNLIYWTHLHKCCYYEAWKAGNFLDLPKICKDNYLEEEIKLIKPEIIIGLGVPVAKTLFLKELEAEKIKVRGYFDDCHLSELKSECIKLEKRGSDVYLTDFPADGKEDRFDMIRNTLSIRKGFEFMRIEGTDNWFPTETDYSNKKLKGLSVNIDFEFKALSYSLNPEAYSIEDSQLTANGLWLQKVIINNLANYDKVTKIVFYLEDLIRTLMIDVFSDKRNWRIIDELRKKELYKGIVLNHEVVYKYLGYNWDKAFKDYCTFQLKFGRNFSNKMDISNMHKKIRYLKFLRNKIVHNSGRIEPSELHIDKGYFPGIKHYVSLIVIEEIGLNEIKIFAEEVIELIKLIDRKRQGVKLY